MSSDVLNLKREASPSSTLPPSSIPQKRTIEEDHSPLVSSPLKPDTKPAPKVQIQAPEDVPSAAREKRAKKESLKKREAKGAQNGPDSSRATPDPKDKEVPLAEMAPIRYKIAHPKLTDFEPSRSPVFLSHHEVQDAAGRTIEFHETSEQ